MGDYAKGDKSLAIVSGPIKVSSSEVSNIKQRESPGSKLFNGYFKSLETQGRSR